MKIGSNCSISAHFSLCCGVFMHAHVGILAKGPLESSHVLRLGIMRIFHLTVTDCDQLAGKNCIWSRSNTKKEALKLTVPAA